MKFPDNLTADEVKLLYQLKKKRGKRFYQSRNEINNLDQNLKFKEFEEFQAKKREAEKTRKKEEKERTPEGFNKFFNRKKKTNY